MNPLESQLAYPFGDTIPPLGTVHDIAPGLRWLRMPLPFALDHINLWLLDDRLEGREGLALVDCGASTEATRAAWEQLFDGAMGGQALLRVFATHCHPDHVGLSGWLCERFRAPFWTSAAEFGFARMMAAALPGVDGPSAIPHFQKHGLVDAGMLEQMQSRRNYYPSLVPAVPPAYTRLQDGQRVRIGGREWRVITGFGHSPEHVSLYAEEGKILISGDMVLPRISTNVSVSRSSRKAIRSHNISLRWTSSPVCRTTPWCCLRTVNPSAACMCASNSCAHTTLRGWTRCAPPAANRAPQLTLSR